MDGPVDERTDGQTDRQTDIFGVTDVFLRAWPRETFFNDPEAHHCLLNE